MSIPAIPRSRLLLTKTTMSSFVKKLLILDLCHSCSKCFNYSFNCSISFILCEICGFHSGENSYCGLLVNETVWFGRGPVMFLRYILKMKTI
jgi:hypothetical protein